MLDIKFVRDNPDAVKENIKKKFQDAKLPLVDEVIEKDAKYRECLKEVESLKAARNKLSKANMYPPSCRWRRRHSDCHHRRYRFQSAGQAKSSFPLQSH